MASTWLIEEPVAVLQVLFESQHSFSDTELCTLLESERAEIFWHSASEANWRQLLQAAPRFLQLSLIEQACQRGFSARFIAELSTLVQEAITQRKLLLGNDKLRVPSSAALIAPDVLVLTTATRGAIYVPLAAGTAVTEQDGWPVVDKVSYPKFLAVDNYLYTRDLRGGRPYWFLAVGDVTYYLELRNVLAEDGALTTELQAVAERQGTVLLPCVRAPAIFAGRTAFSRYFPYTALRATLQSSLLRVEGITGYLDHDANFYTVTIGDCVFSKLPAHFHRYAIDKECMVARLPALYLAGVSYYRLHSVWQSDDGSIYTFRQGNMLQAGVRRANGTFALHADDIKTLCLIVDELRGYLTAEISGRFETPTILEIDRYPSLAVLQQILGKCYVPASLQNKIYRLETPSAFLLNSLRWV